MSVRFSATHTGQCHPAFKPRGPGVHWPLGLRGATIGPGAPSLTLPSPLSPQRRIWPVGLSPGGTGSSLRTKTPPELECMKHPGLISGLIQGVLARYVFSFCWEV